MANRASMDNGRSRASKLPRYILSNITVDREGSIWMDGMSSLDLNLFPLLREDIPEPHLSHGNLPPFYRQLSNTQAKALESWSAKGNLSKEALGNYWPCDFNADGKLKRSRLSWEIGKDEPPARPTYLTHMSSGRPMKSMRMMAAKTVESQAVFGNKTGLKRGNDDNDYDKPEKVILLQGNKDDDRILQLECKVEQREAELKMAKTKYDGLHSQLDQVESAMDVRKDLITNAIVNYHFANINLHLLAPHISTLANQALSQDDIAGAAGGMATLDHRVSVVKEIAQRLNIPIEIERDITGEDDTRAPPQRR